jgi:hypothetical protein
MNTDLLKPFGVVELKHPDGVIDDKSLMEWFRKQLTAMRSDKDRVDFCKKYELSLSYKPYTGMEWFNKTRLLYIDETGKKTDRSGSTPYYVWDGSIGYSRVLHTMKPSSVPDVFKGRIRT